MVYLGLAISMVFVITLAFVLYKFLNDKGNNLSVYITLTATEQVDPAEAKEEKADETDSMIRTIKLKLIDAEKLSDETAMVEAMEEVTNELKKMEKLMELSIQRAEHIEVKSGPHSENLVYFPGCQ